MSGQKIIDGLNDAVAGDMSRLDKARRFADAQKCIADVFESVTL